ncbi:ABC transporter substrate-binding protein [Pseudohoeflea coraliihabitans]|uniref:Extracellular solute-binding protein n=1 Tax=Pseudohoeflea coraliihabitans TaxID=2860393 RepID=A0ABS6WQY1_9HYPH|nr:extracellular solute-binding protein [Pseudohoeflea sp. DP4N28-3]MBW3097812.1 extracellular solute-binding protein [Pseudohoeflea sp. DP4N28-3]
MSNMPISRRSFVAGVGALAGSSALIRPDMLWAQELGNQELRTVGLSVTVQERILNDFKAKSGVGSVSGKADIFPNTQTELLSGSNAYDCWEIIGERLPAMTETKTIAPIPTSSLSNWNSIRPIFTEADSKMEARAQISGQIWADDAQSELWMVPTVYNFDSIGYRPDLVSAEEANTWTALFDDKFKGKTGLNVDPLIAFGQAILAMNSLGLLDVPNPGNPTKEQIDEASKFLISKKKGGQFRALWGDFGELVNLLASGEMILADAWQPAVMAVKAQGIECSYAVPKEGYRAWAIGISQIASSENAEAVRAYADYWLSGDPGVIVSEQGYYSPTTTIKDVMAPEKYGFWYEGKPWEGPEERGIKPGDLRDGGSLEERASHVSYWHQWPDEYDHLIMRWDEFLSA